MKSDRRTYQWYTGTPVFEFGHGLHYTNFTAAVDKSKLADTFDSGTLASQASPAKYKDLKHFATVPVTVRNSGTITSDFVILAFLKGEYGPKPYPKKRLVGFARVHNIPAGGSASAAMEIEIGTIARANEKGDLVLFPGKYSLVLDVDEKDKWEFSIGGSEQTLDVWPAR
jgi:beta-D-xylosidase 4